MPDRLTPSEYEQAAHVFGLYRKGAPDAGLSPSIRKWQRRIGVTPDGIPGPNTRAALARLAPEPEPVPTEPVPLAFNGWPLGGATRYSLREHGPAHRLSPNFTLVEFASKDGADEVLVHPALIALLERIRAEVGGPVTINSGYRTPAHNAHVGGASSSRHKYGQAADIHVRGMTNAQVYAVAKALNPGGLGKYHSFTHVDIEGVNRRWDGP